MQRKKEYLDSEEKDMGYGGSNVLLIIDDDAIKDMDDGDVDGENKIAEATDQELETGKEEKGDERKEVKIDDGVEE